MRKTLFALALALGIGGFTGSAQASWEVGDRVVLGSYCNLASPLVEGDMRAWAKKRAKQFETAVTADTMEEGWANYVTWIKVPDECADARLNRSVGVVSGALMEKMYEFEASGGGIIEIWLWRDDTGQPGLTWLSPKPPEGSGA